MTALARRVPGRPSGRRRSTQGFPAVQRSHPQASRSGQPQSATEERPGGSPATVPREPGRLLTFPYFHHSRFIEGWLAQTGARSRCSRARGGCMRDHGASKAPALCVAMTYYSDRGASSDEDTASDVRGDLLSRLRGGSRLPGWRGSLARLLSRLRGGSPLGVLVSNDAEEKQGSFATIGGFQSNVSKRSWPVPSPSSAAGRPRSGRRGAAPQTRPKRERQQGDRQRDVHHRTNAQHGKRDVGSEPV